LVEPAVETACSGQGLWASVSKAIRVRYEEGRAEAS